MFYVVFGVDSADLQVSRKRHKVDGFPENLELILYEKPKHTEYMELLFGGSMGNVLRDNNPQLYEAFREADRWTVIRGEIKDDANLHYMRNAIGFVQALIEKGALGIFDLFTLRLFSSAEWTGKIFEPEFDPYSHITIYTSEMDDGSVWLHTQGMRKFGRPDSSMEGVPYDMVENAVQVINQMIFYGAQGVFFTRDTMLHTHTGIDCVIKPQFIDDMENPDFNNSYYRMNWSDCEIELGNK